ncbi:MAG: alpha/beta hydrolase family protein, partial [Acidimicrobiia bacterium]|nr:alpha/beta hydrolase family protein [Acidimicrobiia bacterium]
MYDAPDNLAEAALDRYASAGDIDIARFVGSLMSEDRRLVVIGHSYGSTVMGESLLNGLGEQLSPGDDVVILGSPGVHADHASDLGVAGTIWAAQVDGDEIAFTGLVHNANCLILDSLPFRPPGLECEYDEIYHHGVNPVHPSFGATVFETGTIPDVDVGFLEEFGDEHSEYWAMVNGEPSEALANLIRIIQADYESITVVEP